MNVMTASTSRLGEDEEIPLDRLRFREMETVGIGQERESKHTGDSDAMQPVESTGRQEGGRYDEVS